MPSYYCICKERIGKKIIFVVFLLTLLLTIFGFYFTQISNNTIKISSEKTNPSLQGSYDEVPSDLYKTDDTYIDGNIALVDQWYEDYLFSIQDLEVSGNLLFILSRYFCNIYNISVIDAPIFIGSITSINNYYYQELFVENQTLYIFTSNVYYETNCLEIYNISKIAEPEIAGVYFFHYHISSFCIENHFVFYADYWGKNIWIVNTTDPMNITETKLNDFIYLVNSQPLLVIKNNLLYVQSY